MFLRIEETPNPNTIKFIPEEKLNYVGTKLYSASDNLQGSLLLKTIFSIKGVTTVLINSDFISVSKKESEDWAVLKTILSAKIGSPGFLATHPNGKILYSVGRWDEGPGALGYHIGKNGELSEFTRMICPDGGSAHIAVHPSGKFLLTAQYGGGSVALFPLDANGQLGEPTVTEHKGGSKVVDRRQDSPHPHWAGFSPDGKYALIPDLGLD